MGNLFTARGVDGDLQLSNGSTAVLFDVLVLAGSQAARTPWEQHLVLLFADSERMGYGIGGFDAADLPWTEAADSEIAFFRGIVALARTGHGWDLLGYEPTFVADQLATYARMLEAFEPAPNAASAMGDWSATPPSEQLERCTRHGVLRGEYGCRLCG